MGYSPWGHKELDMTERLTLSFFHFHTKVCFPFCLKIFFSNFYVIIGKNCTYM